MVKKFPSNVRFSTIGSFVKKIHDFLHGKLSKRFAALCQALGKVNGDILHLGVGLLGSAHEEHLLGPSNAFVFILIIEADTEQT
jgi:hypothetical protein